MWEQLGGVGSAGEDVIIGIVDGGIWPEHPSFSDRTGLNGNGTKDGKLSYQQIPGWHGKCVPGEEFNASMCNQKLIGAQYFNAGWGGNAGIDAQLPWEFNSPRDFGGHGTHTAIHRGRQLWHPGHRRSLGVRQHQRHRAARPHRGLQGLLADPERAARASTPTASPPLTRRLPTAWT